jgi:hypothetical protein
VKFNKYKLQYPRIRESEIISKIIKEWEAMDENEKENIGSQYVDSSGKAFLDDPSSSSKDKDKNKAQVTDKDKDPSPELPFSSSAKDSKNLPSTGDTVKKLKKPPSPKVRTFQDKATEKRHPHDFGGEKSPAKKDTPDKPSTSSSQIAIDKAKKQVVSSSSDSRRALQRLKPKPVTKNEDYITFYKYYHDRLRIEHPRWNNGQITTIIRLLWKKRGVEQTKRPAAQSKAVTGRQLYSRTKLN